MNANGSHGLHLRRRRILAPGDHRPGMPHPPARRSRGAGDEANHRFVRLARTEILGAQILRSVDFSLPADLAGRLARATVEGSGELMRLSPELQRRCGALVSSWSSSLGYWVALLADGRSLAALDGLAAILTGPERAGLVVMAATNSAASSNAAPKVQGLTPDYQLRFFAPGLGIDEDPVTGSAHALVAPYWLERTGRHQVVGWQPSQRPGGMVASAAASGMIQLHGSGHLLWDGRLHFKSGDYSCGDGGLGEWAALVSG